MSMSVADAIGDARVVVMDFPLMDFTSEPMFHKPPPSVSSYMDIINHSPEEKAIRTKACHQVLSKFFQTKASAKRKNMGNAKKPITFSPGLKKMMLNFLVGAKLVDRNLLESLKSKSPGERKQAVANVIAGLKKFNAKRLSTTPITSTSVKQNSVQLPNGNFQAEGATGECVFPSTASKEENNLSAMNNLYQKPMNLDITPQMAVPVSDFPTATTTQLGNSGGIDHSSNLQQAVEPTGQTLVPTQGNMAAGNHVVEQKNTQNPVGRYGLGFPNI